MVVRMYGYCMVVRMCVCTGDNILAKSRGLSLRTYAQDHTMTYTYCKWQDWSKFGFGEKHAFLVSISLTSPR